MGLRPKYNKKISSLAGDFDQGSVYDEVMAIPPGLGIVRAVASDDPKRAGAFCGIDLAPGKSAVLAVHFQFVDFELGHRSILPADIDNVTRT